MSRRLVGRVTKYDCDRCGKEFAEAGGAEKPNPDDSSVKRGASILAPIVDGDEISFQTKDLCGSCVSKFTKWISPKK
jgi:hypothetical protein